ncbi:MAG: lipase family protein [Myxococcaceae bacterium]
MEIERVKGAKAADPFPVYDDPVASLLVAHTRDDSGRDAVVAHVLGTCAGYAYADTGTVAMVMARLGLGDNACVRVSQTVDAMFVFSTVYLVQSRCGRIVILCYRGTEPGNLFNWLGDADTESEPMGLGAESARVHAGFHRNVRATRLAVTNELQHALERRSLLDPTTNVDHPLEALYVTGHSLGGAMAALLALSVAGTASNPAIAEKLRAVYTFGQPMVLVEPLPKLALTVGRRLFRHITTRDIIPALPATTWGKFAHFGQEYRLSKGEWQRSEIPTAPLTNMRQVPRSVLALLSAAKLRDASRYTLAEHGPHNYIAALRPRGKVTEFGDR